MATDQAATKAPTKRQKRKPRRPKPPEYVEYLIQVTSWEYYYSLRTGDPKSAWDKEVFDELANLSFRGNLIAPKLPQIERVLMEFSAKAGMLRQPIEDIRPKIGSVCRHGDELSAYVFVPEERMADLLTIAQSERVKVISFVGDKLRYGSALIHNMTLRTEINEDDIISGFSEPAA